ncbi:hypothetical protein ACKWTF_008662 [Chironomus riparius]
MSQISILTEFIEIYITQILYLRSIYPRQIFRKHKAYGLPVYCSIYPPLNEYLKESIKATEELINKGDLETVEVLIYNENHKESFMIDKLKDFKISDSDKYLMSIHEDFRKSIYELETKCKALRKFSRSYKFKILLHTKEKAYRHLSNESKYQDFLWIKDSIEHEAEAEILPITSSLNFMSIYVKQF